MRKSELFKAIVESVACEMELNADEILSTRRTANIVDARHIIVHLLFKEGVYIADIAHALNLSRRAVEKIRSTFDGRLDSNRKLFKLAYDRVSNDLRRKGVLADC